MEAGVIWRKTIISRTRRKVRRDSSFFDAPFVPKPGHPHVDFIMRNRKVTTIEKSAGVEYLESLDFNVKIDRCEMIHRSTDSRNYRFKRSQIAMDSRSLN